MKENIEYQRLRWQCRRGMLELDLILLNFLDKNFATWNQEDQNQFQKLSAQSDVDLQDWLIYKIKPEDPEIDNLIKRIKLNR